MIKELLHNAVYFTHPVTGMTYKKLDGDYYYKSSYPKMYLDSARNWIKSGMKRGFVLKKV